MQRNDPGLTVLHALISLARTGSVSRTAAELGLTQSAVSRAIAAYEKLIGLSLVRRDVRPLTLTEAGELVLAHGVEIDRSLQALNDRLLAVRQNQSGSVRIGSFGPTASAHILPDLLARFARQYPGINAGVFERTAEGTLADLRNGNVDVAVLSAPAAELESIPIAADQLVALVPAESELAAQEAVTPTQLAGLPFIMTLAGSEAAILAWFAAAACQPNIAHRLAQTHSMIALVRAGLGNAIVTSLSLPAGLDGIAVVPLKPAAQRQIYLVRVRANPRSRASALFWKFVDESRPETPLKHPASRPSKQTL